jgi:nucleoside-diphosphate-sugar epimerase
MKKKINGVFNIASGKAINLLKIFLIINKNIKYNLKTSKPKKNILANINKIKNIGWRPKYNFSNILENFKKKI